MAISTASSIIATVGVKDAPLRLNAGISQCRVEFEPSTDGPKLGEYLDTVFKATMLMLEEMMVMGIDRDEIAKMETPEEPDPKEHPLYKEVYELSFSMHDWLEKTNRDNLHQNR